MDIFPEMFLEIWTEYMIEMEKVFVIYTDLLIMPLDYVVIVNQLTTFVLLFPIV